MSIKLAIVEDNKNLALTLKEKIENFSSDIKIEYIAKNGLEMVNYLAKNDNIDVILMDIEMPVMDGITATKQIKELDNDIKIIILTVFDEDQKILEAIQSGANGYLLKDESTEQIVNAINIVLEGGAMMTASIAAKTLTLLKNFTAPQDCNCENIMKLTNREIEILEHIKEGLDYKEIADKLFISPATVRKHIENIYEKLQAHNKMQAVQKAIKYKII